MQRASNQVIDQIDRMLEPGNLDASVVERLVDLLTPDTSDPWPELEVVLHVAEHPVIADDLQMHDVDPKLEQAIAEALDAVLPTLGIRPYGPTYKIAEIARRRLDTETRKYRVVVDKADEIDRAEGIELVGRYLETEPAPIFVNRLRQLFPELVAEAREGQGREVSTGLFDGRAETIDVLRAVEGEVEAAAERIRAWFEEGDFDLDALPAALGSDDWREQLVAGVIVGLTEAEELVPAMLRLVVEGSEAAPQLAVVAGHLDPRRTRTVFSQFLAEVTWQNPELPDAELTPERVRGILSARAVMPHVDSPMGPMSAEDVPDSVEDDQLRQLPERVERWWRIWSRLHEIGGSD